MFGRKNILIINNGLDVGGIERASVSLANHFAKLENDITLLALYKSEHFYTLDKRIRFLEPEFSRRNLGKIIYVIKMMAFLRRSINNLKPDVILAFSEWTNPFVVLAAYGMRVPLFLTDRMSPNLPLTPIHRFLKRTQYKKANGIIAQTNHARRIIGLMTGANNIKVIYNPVNSINRIECVSRNRIVTVGRLSKEKGHKYLIEAFSRLLVYDWELIVVGDGTEREPLQRLAHELGVSDRIIFHGHKRDFSLQLSEAKIFVLPSLSEGFPNALIEAMSVPLACISTNCIAGPSEIIQDGVNGLLIEPGNVDALANALKLLIENPNLRETIAFEAYKVRETLSFDKIAGQYLNFIFQ